PLERVALALEAPHAVLQAPCVGIRALRVLVVHQHVPVALQVDRGGRLLRHHLRGGERGASTADPHRQILRSTRGKSRHTGTPQKWLRSVQRGLARPSRTKQGGPTWRTSSGCTARTWASSFIDASKISRWAL